MTPARLLSRLIPMIFAALTLACGDSALVAPELSMELVGSQAKVVKEPQAVPFHGSTTGGLVGMIPAPEGRCPPQHPLLLMYEGAGTATHMGRITVVGSECAYFNPQDPSTLSTGQSQFTFTAANGDQLFVAYDQTTIGFEPAPSPWLLWSAAIYATGGTGRLEGAVLVDVRWNGGANLMTNETYSSFDGWIRYDASNRSGK
ncbi:MAG: hypothetical protein ABIF09_12750 [Gemmatimonadota bacterium]